MSEPQSHQLYSQLYDFAQIEEGLPKFQVKEFPEGVLTFNAVQFPDKLWQHWMFYEKDLLKYKHILVGQSLNTKIEELGQIIDKVSIQKSEWHKALKRYSLHGAQWEKNQTKKLRKKNPDTYAARLKFFSGQKEIALKCWNACSAVIQRAENIKRELSDKVTVMSQPEAAKLAKKKNYSDYTVAAFCYYFLMKMGLRPDYKSKQDKLQTEAIKAICREFKLNSAKAFQLKFNLLYMCAPSKLNLHTKRGDPQEILNRLKPYPAALSLAEKNLTKNEGNR